MADPVLVAIGGGGATHGADPALDRLCLERVRARPRIGYVGWASGDDAQKAARFRAALAGRAESIEAPPAGGADMRGWAAGRDLVYLGGGDCAALMERMAQTGLAAALKEAARRGTVLAGVSAGASCLFARYVWRAEDGDLRLAEGAGLFEGAFVPHCQSEPDRIDAMAGFVARGEAPVGYAVDDGAALILDGGRASGFASRADRRVRRMRGQADGDGVVCEDLAE